MILALLALGLIFVFQRNSWKINPEENPDNSDNQLQGEISPLSGLACLNYQRRPIAIVLANDPVARPLSGLSQADLVIEMPVITSSITRMLAFYVCELPEEVGSMRSARHDFIPLAEGFDAILVHWGGSHFALDKLNAGTIDNVDALKNPYNAFYQKASTPQPHNGFSSANRLLNSIRKLGYRLENQFEGYEFQAQSKKHKVQNDNSKLKIQYSYPYNVEYQYDPETNSYLRWRTGTPEIDANNGQQIRAKNIVVMEVFSKQIEGPYYNDLELEGDGQCRVYQNGEVIPCIWQKSEQAPASKLEFLDENGEEISFIPGQIWIEIVEPGQEVIWE